MTAIDRELRVIDSLLRDLQSRWARAKKAATASPIEFGLQLLRTADKIWQMNTEQIVAFDYIRIAFFDKCGESPDRVSLGFFYIVRIDKDQFFPARVVRQRDAYGVIVGAGVTDPGYRKHFELHPFEFLKCQILEQSTSSYG